MAAGGSASLTRLAHGLSLACVAGILWSTWSGVQSLTRSPSPAPAAARSIPQPAAAGTPDPGGIPGWHLFGSAEGPAPRPAATPAPPPTRLQLKLTGVLAAAQPQDARAIITRPGAPARTYRLGEAVDAGARLHEVHADHVLLERNGRYETLGLERIEDLPAPPPGARPGPARRPLQPLPSETD